MKWVWSPATTVVCLSAALICACAAFLIAPARGAIAELYGAPSLQGPRLLHRIVPAIDPRLIVRDPAAPREGFSARWTAAWHVDREAEYTLQAAADDRVRITIDDRPVILPARDAGIQHGTGSIRLSPGLHVVRVEYEQNDGGMFLDTIVSENGGPPQPLPVGSMFAIGDRDRASSSLWIGRALWILAALAAAVGVWSIVSSRTRPPVRLISGIALALILLLAGALRLDVLLGRHGSIERPAWLHTLDRQARLPLTRLAPMEFQWARDPRMYQSGDPAAYLFFAREMKHFYEAHPREPLFVGLTRSLLPLAGQQDVAVGLASSLSSLLLVAAVYALGAIVASRWVGLLAALAMAVERDAIVWSPEGWRDETFSLFFIVFACLAIRVRRQVDMPTAIAIGVVTAGALLTRVTSLAFIAVGGLAVVLTRRPPSPDSTPRRQTLRCALTGGLVALVLAGPYFVNCYRTFGDPLHAIDVHTAFYRNREGLPSKEPLSAAAYIRSRFAEHPVRLTGTFLRGMTTYPFLNKWQGFDDWLPNLGRTVAVLSVAGLILLIARDEGRILLVMTAASLLPYAFTHDIAGGAEWRFTLHVYPVLLVAAALALEQAVRSLVSWREAPRAIAAAARAHWVAVSAGAAIMIAAALIPRVWPYLDLSEDLWFSRSYSIVADPDHALLFPDGWSEPVRAGNVTSRSSAGPAATVWLPIARKRTHHVRLRLDPLRLDEAPQELRVFINRQLVSTQPMQIIEGRVGAYDVIVPGTALHSGLNRLDLLVTRKGGTGDPAAEPDGIRFWYARVTAM